MSSKRARAIAGAAATDTKVTLRQDMVVALLLSLIECGRVPTLRHNGNAEAIETATARPRVKFSLPWTGAGNSMSLPQSQTVVFLSRDPTNAMMYYDYNNGGAAGAAQQAVYAWVSSFSSSVGNNGTFTIPSSQAVSLKPCWAINSGSQKAFHGNRLFAKTYGDRTYLQADAPPNNADTGVSQIRVTIPNQAALKIGDEFNIALYRLAEGTDVVVTTNDFIVAVAGTGGAVTFAVPFTDKYRVQVNYTSIDGSVTQVGVSVSQTWSCGTLCCNPLPQIDSIWQNLNRLRILGANVDVINQTPEQFRGGNVVATQLAGGTSEYIMLQGQTDPYTYISTIRGVESRDFKKGNFSFLKPDGDDSFNWRKPFYFDGGGNIIFARSDAFFKNGFVAIAVSAPDLVTGTTATTTRGQVTLDFGFSVEIDSQYNWLEYNFARASEEEWERAEEILAHFPQHWDDPDWGKIWNTIKTGAGIGAKILGLVPDPRAQLISRGVTRVIDVLQ